MYIYDLGLYEHPVHVLTHEDGRTCTPGTCSKKRKPCERDWLGSGALLAWRLLASMLYERYPVLGGVEFN